MKLINASELRTILDYDPEDGLFRWREDRGRIRKGSIASHVNPVSRYRVVKVAGRSYMQHRLAFLWMTGRWPIGEVDHENMDRADNRWENLRDATRSQNLANTKPRPNKYGFRGVTLDRYGKWISQIQFEGKKICIGLFETPEEAHRAYALKQKELYGEFARTA